MKTDLLIDWTVWAKCDFRANKCILKEMFLLLIIPFTGTYEPNKLTNWHLSGFIAQLVRALHWHRRGHQFESRWKHPKFSWCICETIAEIVQQLWGSFLKLKCILLTNPKPHQRLSSDKPNCEGVVSEKILNNLYTGNSVCARSCRENSHLSNVTK